MATQSLCNKLIANDPAFTECKLFVSTHDEMSLVIASLKRNTTLQTVELNSECLFPDFPALVVLLVAAFMDHPKLKGVVLDSVRCNDFGPIALAFLKSERLSSLTLKHSVVTETIVSQLRLLLTENALESLVLQSCRSDSSSGEGRRKPLDLSGAITSNRSLKELAITNTLVTEETVRDISRFIRENQVLETIRLGTEVFYEASNSLAMQLCVLSAVQGHESVRRFIFVEGDSGDCWPENDILVEEIGNMVRSAPMLRSLHLLGFTMSHKGLCRLLHGLGDKNCRIEELSFENSYLGYDDAGWRLADFLGSDSYGWRASALADFLRSDSKLKILSLEDTGMGDDEASLLASALEKNATLESLNLANNEQIGPEGAAQLANALRTNTSLTYLDLGKCRIEDEGAVSLFEMLRTNTTLESLKIPHQLTKAGMKTVLESLPHLRGLKHLDAEPIGRNCSEMVDDIVNVLEQHNTTMETFKFCQGNSFGVNRSRLDHILKLNQGGRRILKGTVPDSLWPRILARSSDSPDVLFFFLREKPRLCRRERAVTTGKRKGDDSD